MFDVGFPEIVLLFVIGLLVLGPERLPRVAAQLGRWMGKARRTAHQLRMQIEREMTMEDIKREKQQREDEKTAADAAASTPDDAQPRGEDNYPEDEDANDSGHCDAGADDPADSVPDDAAQIAGSDAGTSKEKEIA